jgi:LacI family transcriptional regulator
MNLEDLSKHLKLSQTTVSRALNDFPEVSEKTRSRVKSAAQKFGYRPSHHAARLAKGKAMAIGHVVPLAEHAMINPHFADFIAGAGDVYAQHHYDMHISVVNSDEEESLYRDLARSGKVDGVVVHAPQINDYRIPLLKELQLPFIVHGRCDDSTPDYAFLDINNKRAFSRATEYLIDLGHQRIALLNGLETMSFAVRRKLGFIAAMEKHNLCCDPALMVQQEMIEPTGYAFTKQILALPEPPTAMMIASMLSAMGAMRAIQEVGKKVGEDISIIVYDDQLSFLQNSGEIPLFTSLRSSIREAGKTVATQLIQHIQQPDNVLPQIIWDAEFVIGNSTQRLQH